MGKAVQLVAIAIGVWVLAMHPDWSTPLGQVAEVVLLVVTLLLIGGAMLGFRDRTSPAAMARGCLLSIATGTVMLALLLGGAIYLGWRWMVAVISTIVFVTCANVILRLAIPRRRP